MEDYILKEIDKFGKLIEAIFVKIGLLRQSGNNESICEVTKTELLEKLNLNIETLLDSENFMDILIEEYKFNIENLEQFVELLYEFIPASTDQSFRIKCAAGISKIYKHLDEKGTSLSFSRYYILKQLEQLSKEERQAL